MDDMNDNAKSKEELLSELKHVKHQLAKLKKAKENYEEIKNDLIHISPPKLIA